MKDVHTWAVVLAAGEGRRLSSLTADSFGRHIPKQFCSLHGGDSLFELALSRARSLVSGDRVCAIVARGHEHWWRPETDELQPGNLIVQPRNRGTGNGVLLALATILERDPRARLVFLPADHHVLDEAVLSEAMHTALQLMPARSRDIHLLGVEPDDPDPELGYIVPQQGGKRDAQGVHHFVEKPSRGVAEKLIQQGGLWNSAIFVANGEYLLDLFMAQIPDIVTGLRAALVEMGNPARPSRALIQLYERMTDLDFSRHILATHIDQLRVVPVPHCGWSDLGTPSRVTERVNLLAGASLLSDRRYPKAVILSLAEAVDRADQRCVSMGIH